ncbi:serine/threonine-protein kinase [Nonomuraea sp. NPDC023979]|uniref:serine/threonine-protein kinase n=1 Tax=Nonomuraea sp. NPDC023979 TaxID=3154796 RepID=UPI0033D027B0
MVHDAHGVAPAPLHPVDPRRVGPYRVVGRLGAGGMGVVLAALDTSGARVAVKLIHPAYASDHEFRTRFAREVAVLRRVRSTCVAEVLDADPDAALPWLATEYIPGPTLEAHINKTGVLTGDSVFGLAAGLAEALSAIHVTGVVHRDLKPSNIILGPQGPRVVDFGIARALDGTAMTRTGMLLGSPGWISPEEYRGAEAGPEADIYGWGLVMVYAVTGTPPFGTGRPEVIATRVLGETVKTEAVPEPLRALVDRALAKEPAERPVGREVLSAALSYCRHGDEPASDGGAETAGDITTLLTRTWTAPTAIESVWSAPAEPEADRTGDKSRRGSKTLIAVVASVSIAAGAAMLLPPVLAQPSRSSPATTMPAATAVAVTPPSTPTAVLAAGSPSPSPLSSFRVTAFRGITFDLPSDWRLTEVGETLACLESPDDHGVSGPWGLPCRPDSLVLELQPEPLTWPVASIDGPDQGWTQGNAILPCLAGGSVTADPRYASADVDTNELSARLAHDVLAYDEYATASGGKTVVSDLEPLADGRKAAHRRWKVGCHEEDWTFIQEAWWLPVSRVVFYSLSVRPGKSAVYERIVRSADLTEYAKAAVASAKPAFAEVEKLGMLSLSDDASSLSFQEAKRQWVDENGRHVSAARGSNWYAAAVGTPVEAQLSSGFTFYALRDGMSDRYDMRTLSELKEFIRATAGVRRGFPAFTVSFDERGRIYAVAQEFQA